MIVELMVAMTLAIRTDTYCVREPFPWQAAAVYDTINDTVYLSRETCSWLRKVKRGPLMEPALGLVILGHEWGHSRGLGERRSYCYGQRKAGILARRLGATWKRSRALHREARSFIFQGCKR